MNIGMVCYPTLGGSGVVAAELGHALALKGHNVHFIASELPFRLHMDDAHLFFHEVEMDNYELFRCPDYALPLTTKIAEISKKESLDILHVHYAIPHATSAYLAKQILGTKLPKVITTLHGTDITLVGKLPSYHAIVKFSIERSDGVTAVSHSLQIQTQDYFQTSKPIEVIYNFFIPKQELKGKKPCRLQIAPQGEKILLHSSNFRPVKRVRDVIKIFKEVLNQIPVKLVLLGSGGEIDLIRALVSDYNLDNNVMFIGKSRYVDAYVASADLFLLPSEQESFGLSALEAMAYGVPVIASNIGGIPEVVEHGVSGYLAPVGDVKQMAEFAIDLLTNEKKYNQMSHAGIERAKEKFCLGKIVPLYEKYYQTILSI